MNFFNPGIMSRGPRLRIAVALWEQLLDGLRQRGQGARESGAFLMGAGEGAERTMTRFVLYDDLDPNCLNEGYVRFDGCHYARLWEICHRDEVSVVGDVHTHPYGAGQSQSDRMHPMISIPGHIALIVPNYARAPVVAAHVGVYVYRGRYRWGTYRGARAARVLDLQQAGVETQ